ncbi:type II toxin-antitoxin system YafQ family toxin [Halomonas korlensis]|uniref:mRNA interferase YafQ n=1 Tax=Halomonas korlensis TaxID=463301 RepID=A0A1I7JUB9_9GAMM|nr:type II toxin-antitoxin system YafQ family toxin [Halomonas korlensis]SFU88782.1 mRNA interferase YafQ [Halomonas korlensis]
MLTPVRSSQFKRDIKRVQKRGKDMTRLRTLLGLLLEEVPLPEHYQDYPLRGNWKGYRDAHIEPDWLLLYCVVDDELHLARTGSHADLFQE